MDAATNQRVRDRARNRCEYCRLPQAFSGLRFHVEHIIPRQHGGDDGLENLALACPDCNLHKGTNLTGIHPDKGEVTALFHPRKQRWEDHFRRDDARIIGLTPTGQTTAWLLQFNTGNRLRLRELLRRLGALD